MITFFFYKCKHFFIKQNVMKYDQEEGRSQRQEDEREAEPFWCCLHTRPKCDPNVRNIRAS